MTTFITESFVEIIIDSHEAVRNNTERYLSTLLFSPSNDILQSYHVLSQDANIDVSHSFTYLYIHTCFVCIYVKFYTVLSCVCS